MRLALGLFVGGQTGGWSPLALGAKLLTWHDPTSTFDASGWTPRYSGHTLTSAALPTTSTRNGRRVLVFNGVNQYLTKSFTRAQPSETWVAAKMVGTAPASTKLLFAGGATAGYLGRLSTGDSNLRINAGTSVSVTAASDPSNRWGVFGVRFNGASSQAWDGASSMGTGNAGASAIAGLSLGGNGGGALLLPCEIAEVITTIGTLTDAERALLIAHLSWVL